MRHDSAVAPASARAALKVEDLVVTYHLRRRRMIEAVRGVSFDVPAGTMLAVIGESGSGKSSLVRALCGLTPTSSGRIVANDVDLTAVPYGRRARAAGAAGVGIVFQNPMAALDSRWPVWKSIAEAVPGESTKRLGGLARDNSLTFLDKVGLPSAVADRRPAELSGGQLQRVTIARALAARPRVLLYDEVVSALDVSVRNEILRLLAEVGRAFDLTSVFVSHDMASVVQLASSIAVMYRGEVVEHGAAELIIRNPDNDYTKQLLAAVPQLKVA